MSDERIVEGLRQAVSEVREGRKAPLPAGNRWWDPGDVNVDQLVIGLEAAAEDSVFSEVANEQRLRDSLVDAMKVALVHQIEVSFATRTDPWGNAWAQLKHPPSRATGAMQRGAIESVQQGFYITGVGFRTAEGLQVPYWRFQDKGTSRIPARPFWAVADETIDGLTSLIIDKAVTQTTNRISAEIEEEFGIRLE